MMVIIGLKQNNKTKQSQKQKNNSIKGTIKSKIVPFFVLKSLLNVTN